jgi:hypothetical protein
MLEAHQIRLRGPWELSPLDSAGKACGATQTQQLPAAWDAVLPGFRGTVRYTRRFGKPTNLEAQERVWLVAQDIAGSAAMLLNGEKLPDTQADVTDSLRERNLLQIDVTQMDPAQAAGLSGEIRLEIRATGILS